MTTHLDLQRDIGRMEGRLTALEDRLEKMEAVLERIDRRLAAMETKETERKGAWKVIVTVAGAVSAAVAALIKYLSA